MEGLFLIIGFIVEAICWIVAEMVGRLIRVLFRRTFPSDPGESLRERLARVRVVRRNKAIRRWLKKGDRRGPIPNIGLTCPHCAYSLTGLTSMMCPECGHPFVVHTMIDETAEKKPRRKRRPRREIQTRAAKLDPDRTCRKCGYPQKGLGPDRPCPECGTPPTPSDHA